MEGNWQMLINICTPLYNNTREQLSRAWASLKAQTHQNWVWTLYDDSTQPGAADVIWGFCSDERYKIELFTPHVPSRGNIGLSKRNCFSLAKGDILVELDADDELTPDALATINTAFQHHPDIGFVYSDWAEINPAGEWCRYPDGWAYGYGDQYRLNGRWVMKAPPVNDVTIRHIVSAPNHVRAWRASVYRALGGHDSTLPVADDFELIVRTYLHTRMAHISKLLYKQYISPHTAQRQRNGLIQTLVADIAAKYADQITARSTELGLLKEQL
jgi:glycosyltransferase involved in cell wall biosynthesis